MITPDTKLMNQAQVLASGANVHKMNNLLQNYVLHIHLYNNLMKENKLREASLYLSVLNGSEKELRTFVAFIKNERSKRLSA